MHRIINIDIDLKFTDIIDYKNCRMSHVNKINNN